MTGKLKWLEVNMADEKVAIRLDTIISFRSLFGQAEKTAKDGMKYWVNQSYEDVKKILEAIPCDEED